MFGMDTISFARKVLIAFYLSTVRSRIEINFREQKQSFHFLHILIGAVASIHSIDQMNPQKHVK